MRLTGDLVRLQAVGRRRLKKIRSVVPTPPLQGVLIETELGVTYVVIELFNLWSTFARLLYLCTALGARDANGSQVALAIPRPTTVDDALTPAIRLDGRWLKQQPPWGWWQEPHWDQAQVLLKALAAIGAANQPQVSGALSTSSSVLNDLWRFRNFFAHRGPTTAQVLTPLIRGYAIPSNVRPTEALLKRATAAGTLRPQAVLLDWIDDMDNMLELIV